MNIVYHHRTRSTDAQELGHQVEVVSLVPLDAGQNNAERDAGEALWKKLARRIPYAYEAAQLGYNLVGVPMLLSRTLRSNVDFLYDRYSLFNFAGVITAKLLGIPLVLEVNSPFALEQARDKEIRAVRFAQWTESWICRMAAGVIVVSTPLARLMQSEGIPAAKIQVMPNGVSVHDFQPRRDSERLRTELGLADHRVIGFVGWFRKWHGLDLLLKAFHQSGLASERVKVLLIGDGPAMPELKQFVEIHNLQNSVLFTGPLPHDEVPRYLDLIDVAVQPAANEYCCPMKILEYMALGKPIVAPAQENIQELLTEEEAQFFAPSDTASLASALRVVAHDHQGTSRMGMAAQAAIHSRGFLWTVNAQRVVDLVTEQRLAVCTSES